MTLRALIQRLATETNCTDANRLIYAIQLAASEVWNHADIPGTLEETQMSVNDDDTVITLPGFVQHVRGIKYSFGERITQNTRVRAYRENEYYQSPLKWDILGETPQVRHIDNATTLTIKRVGKGEEAIIGIAGKTDIADFAQEEIEFLTDDVEHVTVNRYTKLVYFGKEAFTQHNYQALDVSANVIAELANDQNQAMNIMLRIADTNSAHSYTLGCGCVDILYKPRLPMLTEDFQVLPDPFSMSIYYKALEILNIRNIAGENPMIYSEKAAALYSGAAQDYVNGKAITLRRPHDPHSAIYSGYL